MIIFKWLLGFVITKAPQTLKNLNPRCTGDTSIKHRQDINSCQVNRFAYDFLL